MTSIVFNETCVIRDKRPNNFTVRKLATFCDRNFYLKGDRPILLVVTFIIQQLAQMIRLYWY